MSPDVSLPQFVVIGHRQRQIEVSLSSGNYSRLLADVQFTRSMGYYMIQVQGVSQDVVGIGSNMVDGCISFSETVFPPSLYKTLNN